MSDTLKLDIIFLNFKNHKVGKEEYGQLAKKIYRLLELSKEERLRLRLRPCTRQQTVRNNSD
jgi:hypothetical protein